jgi:predicted nucleic acid-binding protein
MGATLDTGALIAIERGSPRMQAVVVAARARQIRLSIPAGVVAQAWRGAARPAPLAMFLRLPEVVIVPMDELMARAAGILCGRAGSHDVVDASVVACARLHGDVIYTSDVADLRRLDGTARLAEI